MKNIFNVLVMFILLLLVSCGSDDNDSSSSPVSSCDQLRKAEREFLDDIRVMNPLASDYCDKFKARYDEYIEVVANSSCEGAKELVPTLKEQRDVVKCENN